MMLALPGGYVCTSLESTAWMADLNSNDTSLDRETREISR